MNIHELGEAEVRWKEGGRVAEADKYAQAREKGTEMKTASQSTCGLSLSNVNPNHRVQEKTRNLTHSS